MVDAGGLSTLVTNPKAQSWAGSAAEREAAERQRDRARHEQGLQTLEARPEGSEEWTEMIGQMWENMPWYDRAAILTAIVPGVGDVVGLGADAIALAKDPSWANLGFMGAGILPWVPAGAVLKGARKLGKKSKSQTGEEVKKDAPILSGTAQRIFTNLRNDIPGFYEGGIGKGGKGTRFAKTLPEGLSNAYLARYHPQWRAIQREHNISVADQRVARNALRVSDEKTAEIARIENKIAEMEEIGSTYTGKIKTRQTGKKAGKQTPIKTAEHKKLVEEVTVLKAQARQAAKKAMGQLNQSRSMTKQYLGHDSGLEGLLEHINKVDHVENFKNFDVDNYWKTVGDLVPEEIGKEGVEQIFKQIETLPSIGFNPNKNYQMNIRKVYTKGAGKLDQGLDARLYPVTMLKNVPAGRNPIGRLKEVKKKWWETKPKESRQYASLEDIKDTIFKQPKKEAPFTTGWDQAIGRGVTKPKRGRPPKPKIETEPRIYDSNKEFLEALEETGIQVLNRDEMLKGINDFKKGIEEGNNIPAVITGSAKTDAWEIGGANYMTAIDRRGKVVTIANDEHDLLGKYGKLPGADRYMNVSEPIFVDLTLPAGGKRILSETQEAAKKALQKQKGEAVDQAIKRYEEIPGVKIRELTDKGKYKDLTLPAGFDTKEQWARTQAVAKVKPTKKRQGLPWRTEGDYSRIVREGAFMPMRFAKPLLGEEDRKAGGSVMERNPYDYPPKAI